MIQLFTPHLQILHFRGLTVLGQGHRPLPIEEGLFRVKVKMGGKFTTNKIEQGLDRAASSSLHVNFSQ